MRTIHKSKGRRVNSHAGKFFCVVLFLLMGIYIGLYAERIVKPALISIAELKVKSMITQIVNEAVREKFVEDINGGRLLNIKTDHEGNITLVEADTAAMNRLAVDLTYRIQEKFGKMKGGRVMLPVGTVLGSQILSQVGPSFPFTIVPMVSSKVDFKTEFESQGINQTRHRVFLQVNSTAKVIVPFSKSQVRLQSTVLISETVIVGDVPQTYIFVPEEELIDAALNQK